jgi:hypothetical protein
MASLSPALSSGNWGLASRYLVNSAKSGVETQSPKAFGAEAAILDQNDRRVGGFRQKCNGRTVSVGSPLARLWPCSLSSLFVRCRTYRLTINHNLNL